MDGSWGAIALTMAGAQDQVQGWAVGSDDAKEEAVISLRPGCGVQGLCLLSDGGSLPPNHSPAVHTDTPDPRESPESRENLVHSW